MPRYLDTNEIKQLRDIIGKQFFDGGRDMTPREMLFFKDTKNVLEKLFDKEGVSSGKHRMMYLGNLKRSYKNRLPETDPRVNVENVITVKKIKKRKREVKTIKTKNILKKIEQEDTTETYTDHEYKRITEVKFNSQLSQKTQEMLLDLINEAQEEIRNTFGKEGKLTLIEEEKRYKEKLKQSSQEVLELERQISQTSNFFKEQINDIAMHKEPSDDIYKAKLAHEVLCKTLDMKLKAHKQVKVEYQESFREWKEKVRKQNESIVDLLLRCQQVHAGTIANDKSLVEAGYIQRDVNQDVVNEVVSDDIMDMVRNALVQSPTELENEQQFKMLDEVNFDNNNEYDE